MASATFLVIGHVTKDLAGDGYTIGGGATFAAVTASRLGYDVAVLTRAEPDVAGALMALLPRVRRATAAEDDLLTMLDEVAASGVDALIVGDLGLLAALGERQLPLRLHLSSVAACHNGETAALAAELGAARVILPRHVTLSEIHGLCRALPGVEIEAFILNDGCVFEEGSCHTLHLPGALGGPICLDRFRHDYHRPDGQRLEPPELERLQSNDAAWDQWLWYVFSCGFSVTPEGLPLGPCGLCALAQLAAAGVAAVKIAGRESRLERRLKSVEMVSQALARSAAGEHALAGFAQGLRGKPELCQSGFMCYYRDFAQPPGTGAQRTPAPQS
ncbi:MAG: U32 family peptidase [Dehalococcoidales bacterium]|nr:U32 family peptidase [Dehalococcoidales bacterium]